MEHLQLMFLALQFFIWHASADDVEIVATFAISLWCVIAFAVEALKPPPRYIAFFGCDPRKARWQ